MSGQFKKYGGRYNYQKNEIIQSDSVTTNYLQTKNFVSEYFDGTTRKYMLTINEDIISANDNRIQNVGEPFEPGDAINLEYFHKYNSDVSGGYVKREGDTMIGLLNVYPETNYVTGLKNPLVVDNTNIYNKAYVDTNGVVKYLTDQTINTIQADSNIKVINNDGSTHMGHLWITDQISAGYIQSYDNGYFSAGKPEDAPCSLLLNPKGGNIGIGLAEPTEALDVNGSAIFSGSAEIGQVKIWDITGSGANSNISTTNNTLNIGSISNINLNAPNVNINGTLNMSNNKISGLANPVSATEAVTLGYLQANYSPSSDNTEFVKKSGDTMTGDLTVNGSGGIKSVWVGEYIVNNSSYNIITSSNGAGLYGQKGGSNNQDGLLFRVNNTGTPYTGMVLTSDGNIGINTTTPGEKLDVYGTAQFNNATTGGNNFVNINSNGTMTIDTSASKEQQLILSSSTGEHSHQLLFQVDYGTAVGAASPSFNDAILSSNGNLFIGSYGNKSPISGLTGDYAYTQYNNTTTSNSIIHNGDVTCNNSLSVKGILDMGGYKITSLANPASANEAVTLGYLEANYTPSSGATNFVKKSGDTMTGDLFLTSDNTSYFRFTTQSKASFIEIGETTDHGSTGDLYFSSMGATQTNMAIKANGNIGIGTTTPGEKLDVYGTAQFNNATTGGNNYVNIDSNGTMSINTKGSQDNQLVLDSGFHQMLFQVDYGTDAGATKGSDHDRIMSQNTTFVVGTNTDGNYPNTTYVASENTITQNANMVTCSNDLTVNGAHAYVHDLTSADGKAFTLSYAAGEVHNQLSVQEEYVNVNGVLQSQVFNLPVGVGEGFRIQPNVSGSTAKCNFSTYSLGDSDYWNFEDDVQYEGSTKWSSDARKKHNIQDIDDALSIIKKLNVKKYVKSSDFYEYGHNYNQDASGNYLDESGNIIPETKQEIGVLAQDVRENVPELSHVVHGQETDVDACGNIVNSDMAVTYNDIFSLNVQATQELADKQTELETKFDEVLNKHFVFIELSQQTTTQEINASTIFDTITQTFGTYDYNVNSGYSIQTTGIYSIVFNLAFNDNLNKKIYITEIIDISGVKTEKMLVCNSEIEDGFSFSINRLYQFGQIVDFEIKSSAPYSIIEPSNISFTKI